MATISRILSQICQSTGNDSSQIKTRPTDGRGLLQNERKENMKNKKKEKYEARADCNRVVGRAAYEEGPKVPSTIRVAVSNDALTHSYRIPTLRSTAACCFDVHAPVLPSFVRASLLARSLV